MSKSDAPAGQGLVAEEPERLALLRSYRILDTPPEVGFDDLAALACHVCQAPVGLVGLIDIDRLWFKSAVGMAVDAVPLDGAICSHTIRSAEPLVVEDLAADPRFAANPLVTGESRLRFYAGVSLRNADEVPLGTLCVMDRQPRRLTEAQLDMLGRLGRQVVGLLELRRVSARHEELLAERVAVQDATEALGHDLQHRFKNSLQTIDSLISLQSRRESDERVRRAIGRMRDRLRPLYLIQDQVRAEFAGLVELRPFLRDLVRVMVEAQREAAGNAVVEEEVAELAVPREKALPIGLIVSEFLSNSFQHAFPAGGSRAGLALAETENGRARLELWDDGPGMSLPASPASGLGLQLIQVLSSQVGAKPGWETGAGTRLVLEFPVR
ncbi:MAG TPA: GAF domain-containing protein [Geminicoccus sp.]|uniref:sensor histidine kinase n=1 Tax=Geminicoccus sp. TaxID=2024832 RepID=UPI002CDAEBF5|nr:GAF domain-containing protein [Geminicoccus sp.]HWL71694.1 GAF domain-containing protein [Geminicoccus sp.]